MSWEDPPHQEEKPACVTHKEINNLGRALYDNMSIRKCGADAKKSD